MKKSAFFLTMVIAAGCATNKVHKSKFMLQSGNMQEEVAKERERQQEIAQTKAELRILQEEIEQKNTTRRRAVQDAIWDGTMMGKTYKDLETVFGQPRRFDRSRYGNDVYDTVWFDGGHFMLVNDRVKSCSRE
jgi:predicted Holliday junction resolvase-like endonuclease